MMRFLIALFTIGTFFIRITAFAQASGDYRSAQTGNWNATSTWQTFNGASWIAASSTPTSANGAITIRSGHTVTIPNGFSVTADQLAVDQSLVIASGGQLTLANGTGTDLAALSASSLVQVSGVLVCSNGATIDDQSTSSRMSFLSGGEYRHSYTTTFGDLPTATWDVNSTIRITGFANTTAITAPSTWSQTVGNVVFNCIGQKGSVDFAGTLTDIKGSLIISSTGTDAVALSSNQNPTITIGGGLSVSGTSKLTVSTTGTNTVVNIGGDLNYTSTNSNGSFLTYTGTCTVNLSGNYIQNGTNGRLHLNNTGSTGVGTINLFGNFSLLAGRVDALGTDPANGNLRFVASGVQTFINAGSIIGYVNYYIASTSTLDVSTYALVGSPSNFQLDGTLIAGSTDAAGAIQNSTTRGNIRTPIATRTFSSGSTVIYQSASPQFMNTGTPTTTGVTTVVNNAAGVTLAANVTVGGILRLQNGKLNLGGFKLTSTGTFESTGGVLAGSASSSLLVQGTTGGNWGTPVFDPTANTLGILTMNRTGAGASMTVNSTLQIASQLNLTNGVLDNTGTLSLANGAILTRYNTSSLTSNGPVAASGTFDVVYRTSSPTGGPYASFSTSKELPSDNTSLGNLTINLAQVQDVLQLSSDVTINGALNLSRGTLEANGFNIVMNGTNWNDNSGNFVPGTGSVTFNDSTVVGGSTNPSFNNVLLTGGSYLSLTRNTAITGNIDFGVGSVFDMGTTTLTLSGGTAQTVSANNNTFGNVAIAKSGGAGVQLTSTFNLGGVLQFSSPSTNVTLASNGFLVVKSVTDGTGSGNGSIARLLTGNTVSGNVTVQRYMSGEGKIYRYISTSVSGAMISQWKDDFLITGGFTDPSPKTKICGVITNPTSPSLYYYNETIAGTIDDGYVAYPTAGNATTNSPIVVGRGYAAYIRQCTAPTNIDVTGPINQGTITYPVTFTNTGSSGDGWNLVGNPYPSSIDWDLGGWTKTRISSAIAITDNGSGMIRYYDAGVSNDIPNGVIAAGQGFFVRATNVNPVLRSQENNKVIANAEFYREATPPLVPSFSVTLSDGTDYDRAYVKVVSDAKESLDDFDAPKIANPTFNLATVTKDNSLMAINALSGLTCGNMTISVRGMVNGTYTLDFNANGNYFDRFQFYLVDKFLNSTTRLSSTYSFQVTDEQGSKAEDRFSLQVVEGAPSVTLAANNNHTICGTSDGAIHLDRSSGGAVYSLWNGAEKISDDVVGTGDGIDLVLPTSKLPNGEQTISIRATATCSDLAITTPYAVSKMTPEILSVNSVSDNTGGVMLTAESNVPSGLYQWFDTIDDATPVYEGNAWTIQGLDKPKTFFVAVSVTGKTCASARKPVTATPYESQEGVRIYPNPVAQALTIEVTRENIHKVEVLTLDGRMVRTVNIFGPEKQIIDCSDLARGVYLVVITDTVGSKRTRLVKE